VLCCNTKKVEWWAQMQTAGVPRMRLIQKGCGEGQGGTRVWVARVRRPSPRGRSQRRKSDLWVGRDDVQIKILMSNLKPKGRLVLLKKICLQTPCCGKKGPGAFLLLQCSRFRPGGRDLRADSLVEAWRTSDETPARSAARQSLTCQVVVSGIT
jgi:hypothetical protein